eukprot:8781621-Alexandrium_andersonii.AAC.1
MTSTSPPAAARSPTATDDQPLQGGRRLRLRDAHHAPAGGLSGGAQSGRPASPPSSPRLRTCPGARRQRGSGALSSARVPPCGVSPGRGPAEHSHT